LRAAQGRSSFGGRPAGQGGGGAILHKKKRPQNRVNRGAAESLLFSACTFGGAQMRKKAKTGRVFVGHGGFAAHGVVARRVIFKIPVRAGLSAAWWAVELGRTSISGKKGGPMGPGLSPLLPHSRGGPCLGSQRALFAVGRNGRTKTGPPGSLTRVKGWALCYLRRRAPSNALFKVLRRLRMRRLVSGPGT